MTLLATACPHRNINYLSTHLPRPLTAFNVMQIKHSPVKNQPYPRIKNHREMEPLLKFKGKSGARLVKGAVGDKTGGMLRPGGAEISRDDGKSSGSLCCHLSLSLREMARRGQGQG